jgi:hypothetical protein
MVVLLSTTIISCTQALNLINRVSSVVGLTDLQRKEIILELRKVIPSCPVKIKSKEN